MPRVVANGVLGCALWIFACTASENTPGAGGTDRDAATDATPGGSGGASGASAGGTAGLAGASDGSLGGSSGSSDGAGGAGGSIAPDPATIRACTARIADAACGGDLIGTWIPQAFCADVGRGTSGCREHFYAGKQGALTLNADGTYRYDDQSTGGYTLLVCDDAPPASCENLLEPCNEDPSGYCPCPTAPTGVCDCPGASGSIRTTTGTWTVDPETQKLLLSEDFASVGGFGYCARNDELLLNISGQIYLFER